MAKSENEVNELAFKACEAVMKWAKTPGDHGGNPYFKEFVKLAQKALQKRDKEVQHGG